MRIISLLPGATETVALLGLTDQLVGISHECDYPAAVRNVPVLIEPVVDSHAGSSQAIDEQVRTLRASGRPLYRLREAMFRKAAPDLVITQELCDVCAITPDQIRQVTVTLPTPPAVLTLSATTLERVFMDIERIAAATGRERTGAELVSQLRARLRSVAAHVPAPSRLPRVACLEWLAPLFVAGHWVPDMVQAAGGQDVLGQSGQPSRRMMWKELADAHPDVIILMPCGFTIDRTTRELDILTNRREWQDLPAVQMGRVFVVDANAYFSRPGPRLVDGVELLAAAFHSQRTNRRVFKKAVQRGRSKRAPLLSPLPRWGRGIR
jgi:iron complex transport system substrate-binding protein